MIKIFGSEELKDRLIIQDTQEQKIVMNSCGEIDENGVVKNLNIISYDLVNVNNCHLLQDDIE